LLSTALPRLERQADLSDNRATVLAQDGGMLDKQFIRTESVTAWRVLRFFGLDTRRNKESQTATNRSPKEPDERKHQFAIGMFLPLFSE
jgi:hypothetical protein